MSAICTAAESLTPAASVAANSELSMTPRRSRISVSIGACDSAAVNPSPLRETSNRVSREDG